MRVASALLCALSIASGAAFGQVQFQQSVGSSAVLQNPALKDVKVDQKPGAQLPLADQFVDENGKTITLGSLVGPRPLLLLPIFFRCKGVCEVELQGIINALIHDPQLTPGKDLDVAVLSINPKERSDLALAKKQSTLDYYGKPKTAAGWHFLTGSMPNIRALTDAMGFSFTYDPEKDVVNHPSGIMMITPSGKVSTYMLKGMYEPVALSRDVQLAARSGVAPKTEELYFGCVHVDPLTGKRSLAIQGVMRLFGLATVAAILIGIVALNRRPRLS